VSFALLIGTFQLLNWHTRQSTTLHGVTNQKTSTWNITAMNASKLTSFPLFITMAPRGSKSYTHRTDRCMH